MQTVDVFVGIDPGQNRELVQAGRLLNEKSCAGRVVVEFIDDPLHLGLGCSGG